MKTKEQKDFANPIISYEVRTTLVKYLKDRFGINSALVAQISMGTGLPPSRVLSLTFGDVPENGLMNISNVYTNGQTYLALLPKDIQQTINTLRKNREETDYIFTSRRMNKDGIYTRLHVNTFSHHVSVAIKELSLQTETEYYSAKSLQKCYFYDAYIYHGIDYVQKILGARCTKEVYDYLCVSKDSEDPLTLESTPPIIVKNYMAICQEKWEQLSTKFLTQPHAVEYYKECTHYLEQISTLLDKLNKLS